MAQIFISYAHSDGAEAAEILRSKLSAAGHDVWLDQQRLKGASQWSVEIEEEIDRRDILLALLSNGSFSSEVCRGEQLRGLRKQRRVIPVLLNRNVDRPVYLEAKQFIDFSNRDIDLIIRAVDDTDCAASIKDSFTDTYSTVPRLPDNLIVRPGQLDDLRRMIINDSAARCLAIVAVRAMGGSAKQCSRRCWVKMKR